MGGGREKHHKDVLSFKHSLISFGVIPILISSFISIPKRHHKGSAYLHLQFFIPLSNTHIYFLSDKFHTKDFLLCRPLKQSQGEHNYIPRNFP